MELIVEHIAADQSARVSLREEDDVSLFEVEYRLESRGAAPASPRSTCPSTRASVTRPKPFDRLQRIKGHYDPNDLFRANHPIPSVAPAG
jgi:hypothetical protein